ncbi:rod shape-determining protein MreD [Metabacillus arenae]|uniref:Rod shape-determining protein MreD n=1 Tax=Metabacillus arenae TaxID=2771434 RepID=A0A926NNT3_9BACI|nr:rod shape-determining protein MreD [Metabacillus arenae]MBD1381201.1 rod shape-determining protein MreD [Metabacillus arenae]
MKKFIFSFIFLFFFIMESTFVHLVKFTFVPEELILVPRIVFLIIAFITAYVGQTYGLIYAMVFGLLYDIVYTEVIGIYLFAFTLFSYLLAKTLKVLHGNVLVIIFLSIISIALLEFLIYGIQLLISSYLMTLHEFTNLRLLPTLALNSVLAILLIYPFKKFLTELRNEQNDD